MPSLKISDGKVTARRFNALVEFVNSLILRNGVGYKVSRNRAGTIIQSKPGTSAEGISCPFDMSLKKVEDGDDFLLTLTAGSCNGYLPSNMFEEFEVGESETVKVKLRATSDGAAITSCELIVDNDDPEPQPPTPWGLPLSVDILIGVVKDGVAYKAIGCGSISLAGMLQFETDRVAAPGESTTIKHYAWAQV